MTYSVIGFGNVGQSLAKAFARKGIDVVVATRRSPDELKSQVASIGPFVKPVTLAEAVKADTVMLAVPFSGVKEVAATTPDWNGKTVIDATNAYGTPLYDADGLTSSAINAGLFPGARFAKGFNHLAAGVLGQDPTVHGGRRVIFLASDDETAFKAAAALAEQLGYAPVSLGTLAEGGPLTSARNKSWSPLDFVDLVKFG